MNRTRQDLTLSTMADSEAEHARRREEDNATIMDPSLEHLTLHTQHSELQADPVPLIVSLS
jgi:hypothetical protein